jgi:hypothetical protein
LVSFCPELFAGYPVFLYNGKPNANILYVLTLKMAEQDGSLIPLQGFLQKYSWGKRGSSSLAATLVPDLKISPEEPYAELWFGDHPSGSSILLQSPNLQPLVDYVPKNKERVFGASTNVPDQLPFLFKVREPRPAFTSGQVLSINQALSLQGSFQIYTKTPITNRK